MREPCEHILQLDAVRRQLSISVWSEHGEDPAGWVNIHCATCRRTLESALFSEVAS